MKQGGSSDSGNSDHRYSWVYVSELQAKMLDVFVSMPGCPDLIEH